MPDLGLPFLDLLFNLIEVAAAAYCAALLFKSYKKTKIKALKIGSMALAAFTLGALSITSRTVFRGFFATQAPTIFCALDIAYLIGGLLLFEVLTE